MQTVVYRELRTLSQWFSKNDFFFQFFHQGGNAAGMLGPSHVFHFPSSYPFGVKNFSAVIISTGFFFVFLEEKNRKTFSRAIGISSALTRMAFSSKNFSTSTRGRNKSVVVVGEVDHHTGT